jgi:LacI family transcriptional regulator
MAVTLEDVGRRCGVSRSTVSRVINDSPLVNQRTKDMVLNAIKEMRYSPNFIARSLTKNRTETLAVTLPDIVGGVFPEVIAGMDEVASERGYHVLVVFLGGARPHSATVEKLIRNRRVDAVVTMASTLNDQQVKSLSEWNMPMVCVAQKSPLATIPSVLFDNVGGAVAATMHLLNQGRKKLIHLRGAQGNYDADERGQGFREALVQAGLPVDPSREFSGEFSRKGGAQAVRLALERGVDFDGVFAANDEMAIGAIETLIQRGKTVPGDVAVVGFDDIDLSHFLGLSTIRVPLRELGRAATRCALDLIDGKPAQEHVVLPTELVQRASSTPGRVLNLLGS